MIHQYKLNGFNMIVDAASGSVHSVDEVAYGAIELLDAAICQKGGDSVAGAVLSDNEVRDSVASRITEQYGISADDAFETLRYSRLSAFMLRTDATWTASTVLRARATTAARAGS